MSFHNLIMISQSYSISHLNYCNSIYYGITKSKIHYLDRLLRIIVRIIASFMEQTSSKFAKM